ncbi:IclR family transcriptional regulator [Streptomyces sp. NPDC026672]|uniref:IclR family transcriptional regulator n=1 Tax=unclassified Streptomyces TaxID=2593676 RepID=UPI0033E8CB9C
MTAAPSDAVGDTGRASVLDRASALLTAFALEDTWIGPSELGRRAGLPKPTAYRLALQLTRHGLLEHHEGMFRLGVRLFELGHLVARENVIRECAVPIMTRLRDTTGHSVHLAELSDRDVLYLAIMHGPAGPALPSRVGGRMPAHATALGKALLAHATADVRMRALSGPLERLTSHTIRHGGALRTALAAVAARGSATDLEECRPGLACAAAPVLANDGTAVAALSVSGRSTRFDVAHAETAVRAAAAALTRRLYPRCPSSAL